jgi:CreA protein
MFSACQFERGWNRNNSRKMKSRRQIMLLRQDSLQSSRWNFRLPLAIALAFTLWPGLAKAELIGEVDTAFRWLGKDDKVIVEAYDDPKVHGITCFVSRARTGGFKGTIGVAEDRAEASIACRQVGEALHFTEKLPQQEDVFTERMSILFKRLHIVRLVDSRRNVLIYLTYSDRLIEGSPQNTVTAVPVPRSTVIPVK